MLRREFLRSVPAAATLSAVAGCSLPRPSSVPAFLSYKAVEVEWTVDRTEGYVADLCWLWSDGTSRVFGWQPEAYPDVVQSVTSVRVSQTTVRKLSERFTDFSFILGFSSPDATDLSLLESTFGLTGVSRTKFNRIQFSDRVQIRPTETDIRIVDVESGKHADLADWSVDIGTKNLREQFPDAGVPPA